MRCSKHCWKNICFLSILAADTHLNQSKSLNKLFSYAALQLLFISNHFISFHFTLLCIVQMFCFQFKLFLMKLPELSFMQTHCFIPYHSMLFVVTPCYIMPLQEVVIFVRNGNNPSFQCVKLALLSDVVQFCKSTPFYCTEGI